MIDLRAILLNIIRPTLDLMGIKYKSGEAELMLLMIGLQESRFEHRQQIGGPARSFWQFEKGGGIKGVLNHPMTKDEAARMCWMRVVQPTPEDVYDAFLNDDILGCAFARLLLYSDPKPLEVTWDYYQRNWRPGKPHPETWPKLLEQAHKAFA